MRDDDDEGGYDEDRTRGNATKAAVQSVGHSKSGGHVITTARPGAKMAGKNHIVHAFDDPDVDGADYVFQEYPKHVTVGGKLHVCLSADHEAAVLAESPKQSEKA